MHDDMMNRPDTHEAKIARADLFKLAQYSFKLFKMINDGQELEGWVQAKITKSADYISSVYHFMEYEMKASEYGDHLETAEMYSESVRRAFEQKLTEAKKMAAKVKEKAKKDDEDLDEGWDDMIKDAERRAKERGTGEFEKKKISTGTVYSRKAKQDDSDKDDDDSGKRGKRVKEGVRPENVPAFKRKAAKKDFPVTKKQVDDDSDKLSSKAGLKKAHDKLDGKNVKEMASCAKKPAAKKK